MPKRYRPLPALPMLCAPLSASPSGRPRPYRLPSGYTIGERVN